MMAATAAAPSWIRSLLGASAIALLARALLTNAFWASGVLKLADFDGTIAEVARFGLPAPALVATVTIAVQLLGSLAVVTGRWSWLGAGALGVFTMLATLVAHDFWSFPAEERSRQFATFLEHLGLVGGLMLAAILTDGKGPKR